MFICERNTISLQVVNYFTLEENVLKIKYTKITGQLFRILQESSTVTHGLRFTVGMKDLNMTQHQERVEVEESHVHLDQFPRFIFSRVRCFIKTHPFVLFIIVSLPKRLLVFHVACITFIYAHDNCVFK